MLMFTVLCALLLIALGYALAYYHRRTEWHRLTELRQLVHGELTALQQVMRVNEAYLEARDQLRYGKQ